LATALFHVKSASGGFEKLTALIDSGSEEASNILKLQKIKNYTEISGVSSIKKCKSRHKIKYKNLWTYKRVLFIILVLY